jgi:hypothetical protein
VAEVKALRAQVKQLRQDQVASTTALPRLSTIQVLDRIAADGWSSSEYNVSEHQGVVGALAQCEGFYNGNCDGHGENLLGRCFCIAGWSGTHCEKKRARTPTCTNKDDRCFFTEEAGVYIVSFSRWKSAQWAEGGTNCLGLLVRHSDCFASM